LPGRISGYTRSVAAAQLPLWLGQAVAVLILSFASLRYVRQLAARIPDKALREGAGHVAIFTIAVVCGVGVVFGLWIVVRAGFYQFQPVVAFFACLAIPIIAGAPIAGYLMYFSLMDTLRSSLKRERLVMSHPAGLLPEALPPHAPK
jgi:divalent metal cation (Fe/Co/Zn/Cd) transporter